MWGRLQYSERLVSSMSFNISSTKIMRLILLFNILFPNFLIFKSIFSLWFNLSSFIFWCVLRELLWKETKYILRVEALDETLKNIFSSSNCLIHLILLEPRLVVSNDNSRWDVAMRGGDEVDQSVSSNDCVNRIARWEIVGGVHICCVLYIILNK